MSQPQRDWADAQTKRTACRVCGGHYVELAHLTGRKYDRPKGPGSKILYIHPDSVISLCPDHHRAFDAHALDILSYLTTEEQVRAVEDLGSIESARRRLCPSAYREDLL